MEQMGPGTGRVNPDVSSALSQFAFLIGRWKCEAKLKAADGRWHTYHAAWAGRFLLGGDVIADEYSMKNQAGELIVHGMNVRSFDSARQVWSIRWLNALNGVWTDLAPEELGGVTMNENSISYSFKEPVAAQAYTRATYLNISSKHFTWRGEKSDDGKNWAEFMVVECYAATGDQ